jgi:hypothetical protein
VGSVAVAAVPASKALASTGFNYTPWVALTMGLLIIGSIILTLSRIRKHPVE